MAKFSLVFPTPPQPLRLAMKFLQLFLLLASPLSAEVPKAFAGLLEKEVPVRASIGMVVPPAEIEKYIAKVETAARKNPEWFSEFAKAAKPGTPLPFHEDLGLTKEEYDDYLALWAKREFKSSSEIVVVLRETLGNTWTITATGDASVISTLRYDPAKDVILSPNGKLKRIDLDPPTNRGIGVVAQSLNIRNGEQEKIKSQRGAVTTLDVMIAHQAVINPVEARRHLPKPIRTEQSFLNHDAAESRAGFPTPECSGLEVANDGQPRRCPLVTYCP